MSHPGKYKYSNIELTKVMNIGGDSLEMRESARSNALNHGLLASHRLERCSSDDPNLA